MSELSHFNVFIQSLEVRVDAEAAITAIDGALEKISLERSKYGAYQNTLEHIQSNVTSSSVNLTAANSRIADVDMALQMTEFTKNNILNQSAQAMLAQANQLPQGILQLISRNQVNVYGENVFEIWWSFNFVEKGRMGTSLVNSALIFLESFPLNPHQTPTTY